MYYIKSYRIIKLKAFSVYYFNYILLILNFYNYIKLNIIIKLTLYIVKKLKNLLGIKSYK